MRPRWLIAIRAPWPGPGCRRCPLIFDVVPIARFTRLVSALADERDDANAVRELADAAEYAARRELAVRRSG